MTEPYPRRPVLVGVDGSESSERAVAWAARYAAAWHASLRLLHAIVPAFDPQPLPQSYYDAVDQQGKKCVARAVDIARQSAPDVEVSARLISGFPVAVLLEASRHARSLVLGPRGRGGFTGLLLGSVAVTLAAHGHCPVIVVRGERATSEPSGNAPVVLGVDGSPASEGAIRFAFDAASRWGAPLIALHAWSDFTVDDLFAAQPPVDWTVVEAKESHLLAQRLAGWREKFPEVDVRKTVIMSGPAHSLIQQGRQARLVVVGSRGRGGPAG